MQDSQFEINKNILRKKLPDYLRAKGINVEKNFRCLNPEHRDINPSMSYNSANATVHCFACNATYDIFNLVGIDYNLTTFIDQYNKLKLMYNIQDNNLNQNLSQPITGPATFGFKRDSIQDREIFTRDNFNNVNNNIVEMPSNDSFNDKYQDFSEVNLNYNDKDPFTSPNDESYTSAKINTPMGQNSSDMHITNAVFGKRTIGMPQNMPPMHGYNSQNFQNNGYNSFIKDNRINYKDYLNECHANVNNTDYFKLRGISQAVIDKFNLGFDMRFEVGSDGLNHDGFMWHAAIIPHNDYAFMARNTDSKSKERIRKKGYQGIFNEKALTLDGTIFITEGEFDALSLETLGFNAIALGGVGNTQALIDFIAEHHVENRIFYIALDNDEAGNNCTKILSQAFMQMQIAYKRVDIAYPYKDPNEALIKDKQALLYRLENLETILSYTLQTIVPPRSTLNFIYDNDALSRLSLSKMLYSMTGDAIAIRNTVASIIEAKMSKIIFAGNINQWQLLCALFKVEQNEQGLAQYSSWLNVNFIETKTNDEVLNTLSKAISACKIQGISDFTLIVDLMCMPREVLSNLLPEIGRIATNFNLSVIALMQESNKDLAQSNALQNLEVKLGTNFYEIYVKSCDLQGRTIEFTRYKGA